MSEQSFLQQHRQEPGGSKVPKTVTQDLRLTSVKSDRLRKRSKALRLGLDLLLAAPHVLFLVYAILVFHHNSQRINVEPVPSLRNAARYGPIVFPIAFAAVVGAFLLAFVAWRLEHGVPMLELEYIVSSRNVFSALTTPVSLRSVNPLAPLLFALWALSPLGGQAALRVVEVVPANHTSPWEFQYLDVMSPMLACSPKSSARMDAMPPIFGAFNSALASPGSIKNASMDAFGNLKIPMLESCSSNGLRTEQNG